MSANDPAFPYVLRADSDSAEYGLTKREYFAAMALQGMLSNPDIRGSNESLAKTSISVADVLIKELEK